MRRWDCRGLCLEPTDLEVMFLSGNPKGQFCCRTDLPDLYMLLHHLVPLSSKSGTKAGRAAGGNRQGCPGRKQ